MKQKYPLPTTMISLSGGIDSTYHSWKWLKDHPQERLVIHHVVLKTREERWEKEKLAVEKILNWFRNHGLDNFQYYESTLDIREIHPQILDSTIIGFMEALLLSRKKSVVHILNNTPKDEMLRLGDDEYEGRFKKARNTRAIVLGRSVNLHPDLKSLTKKEMMKEMPKDLLELCWYCRRPKDNGKTCGKCHTCIQVESSLKED